MTPTTLLFILTGLFVGLLVLYGANRKAAGIVLFLIVFVMADILLLDSIRTKNFFTLLTALGTILLGVYWFNRKVAGVLLALIAGIVVLNFIIEWWWLILAAMIALPFLYGLFIAPMQALEKGDADPMKIITTQNTWRAMGKNPYTFDD